MSKKNEKKAIKVVDERTNGQTWKRCDSWQMSIECSMALSVNTFQTWFYQCWCCQCWIMDRNTGLRTWVLNWMRKRREVHWWRKNMLNNILRAFWYDHSLFVSSSLGTRCGCGWWCLDEKLASWKLSMSCPARKNDEDEPKTHQLRLSCVWHFFHYSKLLDWGWKKINIFTDVKCMQSLNRIRLRFWCLSFTKSSFCVSLSFCSSAIDS